MNRAPFPAESLAEKERETGQERGKENLLPGAGCAGEATQCESECAAEPERSALGGRSSPIVAEGSTSAHSPK